jgi:hypothetical protein
MIQAIDMPSCLITSSIEIIPLIMLFQMFGKISLQNSESDLDFWRFKA